MPVFGMNNGTIAIYSYNYGAGNYTRVKKTLRLALVVGFCVTLCICVLYEFVPLPLLSMFDASSSMIEIGIPAIRLLSISLPIGAVSIILSSALQTLGKSHYSLLVNLCRQFIILLPAAVLLSLGGVLEYVWTSSIIAESLSLIIALILSRGVLRMLDKKSLQENI